jgi:hypothetical protein
VSGWKVQSSPLLTKRYAVSRAVMPFFGSAKGSKRLAGISARPRSSVGTARSSPFSAVRRETVAPATGLPEPSEVTHTALP